MFFFFDDRKKINLSEIERPFTNNGIHKSTWPVVPFTISEDVYAVTVNPWEEVNQSN